MLSYTERRVVDGVLAHDPPVQCRAALGAILSFDSVARVDDDDASGKQ